MKKILICTLLLAACILVGCKNKEPSDSTETGSVTTTAPLSGSETTSAVTDPAGSRPDLPTDGVLACEKSGDSLTVTVTLPECAGQEVSLLALTDRQYQYTWSENPDALAGIGQITLDEQGNGSLTLKLKGESDPICVILTAGGGNYITEVG